MNERDNCGICPFFKNEDMYGYGWCSLLEAKAECSDMCNYIEAYEFMTPKRALRVLHHFQKWRRGGKGRMANPLIIGYAIDEAIRHIRQGNKDYEAGYDAAMAQLSKMPWDKAFEKIVGHCKKKEHKQ